MNKSVLLWSSTGCGKSDGSLEWIVNPPLKTCQGTDHDDSCQKSTPKSLESNFGVNLSNLWSSWSFRFSLRVQLWDHGIGWVRNNSAENTGQVTWSEGNTKLGWLVVVFFSLSEDVIVEESDEPFESDELDDGVWNLSWPEWDDTLVHSCGSFFGFNFGPSSAKLSWVFVASSWELHFQFDSFPWAEQGIGDDFSRAWGDGPSDFFILFSVLLSDNVFVDILEDFVETELSESLSWISDKSWSPAESGLSSSSDFGNTVKHTGREFGVDLFLAFGNVEWNDSSVGQSTGEHTSNHALKVVRCVVFITSSHWFDNWWNKKFNKICWIFRFGSFYFYDDW